MAKPAPTKAAMLTVDKLRYSFIGLPPFEYGSIAFDRNLAHPFPVWASRHRSPVFDVGVM
jgi:hypothetical protein